MIRPKWQSFPGRSRREARRFLQFYWKLFDASFNFRLRIQRAEALKYGDK